MLRRQILLLICVFAAGCASPPALTPADPAFPTVSFLEARDNSQLDRCLLISTSTPTTEPSNSAVALPVQWESLWAYAIQYGVGGNSCPEGQLRSDCAHFQAHCLAAGGLAVANPTAVCESGLPIRVRDLAIAFDNASVQYVNVKKIRDYRPARRGDWCFLPRESNNGNPHDHMMFLAAAPDSHGARVYSHTNNRNGNYVPFDAENCLYYRIEKSPRGP